MQDEGADTQGAKGTEALIRAALLGLCGGLLLGGLFLLGVGLKTHLSPADCTGLSDMECGFTHEAAVEMGRRQVIVGAALVALGAAVVVVVVRSKMRPVSS